MLQGQYLKISLITVSRNSSATIKTTLDSIVAQAYPDLEYIIVDGASTDSTLDIVRSYPGLITHCLSEPDQGIYDAMNKGIELATGNVIGILNSDDFFLSDNVLQDVAGILADNPEIEVLLGDVDFVSGNDLSRPVRRYSAGSFKPWMFLFGFMPPHPAVFVRKSAYERIGLFKIDYKIAADFDLLTRLLLVDGAKYQIANKTWVRMRSGGASTSGFKSNMVSTREMKKSLQENGLFASRFALLCRLPFKLLMQVMRK